MRRARREDLSTNELSGLEQGHLVQGHDQATVGSVNIPGRLRGARWSRPAT